MERVVYDQRARALSEDALAALQGAAPVYRAGSSRPRSAALLAEAGPARAPLAVAAISSAAAGGLRTARRRADHDRGIVPTGRRWRR